MSRRSPPGNSPSHSWAEQAMVADRKGLNCYTKYVFSFSVPYNIGFCCVFNMSLMMQQYNVECLIYYDQDYSMYIQDYVNRGILIFNLHFLQGKQLSIYPFYL